MLSGVEHEKGLITSGPNWADFKPGPAVIKLCFMLNSVEHEFILLINVNMPANVGFGDINMYISIIHTISMFMSRSKFMLNSVEHEKSCITSGPDPRTFLFSLAAANCLFINFL